METNSNITAVLVDDEEKCLHMLEWELNQYCPNVQIVAKCTSSKDGLLAIQQNNPDVVFLDIEMPYMNGFEMLERLPNPSFEVVFTTAYDQFAVRAFKLSAIDYLLKPIVTEDLKNAVEKIKKKKSLGADQKQLEILFSEINRGNKPLKVSRIALPTMEGLIFLQIDQIVYCKSDGSYTKVFLQDDKSLLISRTLKELEDMLSNQLFFRVHNSFLINLNCIRKYVKSDGGYLIMSNGDRAKVSRSKKDELISFF